MADPKKETKDDRTPPTVTTPDNTRTGDGPSFVAVNTLPSKKTPPVPETKMPPASTTRDDRPMTRKVEDALGVTDADRKRAEAGMMVSPADRPVTEKVGEKMTGMKERAKDTVMPGGPMTGPTPPMTGEGMTPGPAKKTGGADWDAIQNPGGCGPEGETDYGTRPVSELKKPTDVKDKADLAAMRIMDREKADREKMDREKIISTATMDAAAMRAGMTSKETTPKEMAPKEMAPKEMAPKEMAPKEMAPKEMTPREMTRVEPMAGERTTRQGAAIGTEPTRPMATERPMTGTVVPPGVTTTTPLKPYGTVDESTLRHARDQSVHQDWERFPQINAPEDVGVPTPEGQAERDRKAAERRTEHDMKGDRGPVQKLKDDAQKAKEATKEKAREVREDVDRKL